MQLTFRDVYSQILSVNRDLLADRIEPQRAMAFAANLKVLNEFINTEIKLRVLESQVNIDLGTCLIAPPPQEPELPIGADNIKQISNAEVERGAERTRKPKMGFVGLSPQEAGAMSESFGEFADLLFWKDDGRPKLRPLGKCDVVFVNLSQTSHATTQYLLAHGLAERNMVKVTGGASAMKYAVKSRFEDLMEC